jgi:hypothetical protein
VCFPGAAAAATASPPSSIRSWNAGPVEGSPNIGPEVSRETGRSRPWRSPCNGGGCTEAQLTGARRQPQARRRAQTRCGSITTAGLREALEAECGGCEAVRHQTALQRGRCQCVTCAASRPEPHTGASRPPPSTAAPSPRTAVCSASAKSRSVAGSSSASASASPTSATRPESATRRPSSRASACSRSPWPTRIPTTTISLAATRSRPRAAGREAVAVSSSPPPPGSAESTTLRLASPATTAVAECTSTTGPWTPSPSTCSSGARRAPGGGPPRPRRDRRPDPRQAAGPVLPRRRRSALRLAAQHVRG